MQGLNSVCDTHFDKGLKYFQKLSGAPKGVVLYDGDLEFENDELKVSNFRGYFNQFAE